MHKDARARSRWPTRAEFELSLLHLWGAVYKALRVQECSRYHTFSAAVFGAGLKALLNGR